jgi:hypothetical protein
MSFQAKKPLSKESAAKRIDYLGGEPLAGSGFEEEKPDEGFSGAVLLPSTFLPDSSKASRSDQ